MEDEQNTNKNNKKVFIMLFLDLVQLGTLIWHSIELSFYLFFIHVTNWSFCISSIYLFLSIICDMSNIFFPSPNLSKLGHFVRNSFSKVAFPYCFMITIGFWGIILIGLIMSVDTFLRPGSSITVFRIVINLHLHLGITIIMLVELFLFQREEMTITLQSGIANTVIFIAYATTALLSKYVFDEDPYYFMKNMNPFLLIIIGFVIFVLLIGCVFLYNLISNRINRTSINLKKSLINDINDIDDSLKENNEESA